MADKSVEKKEEIDIKNKRTIDKNETTKTEITKKTTENTKNVSNTSKKKATTKKKTTTSNTTSKNKIEKKNTNNSTEVKQKTIKEVTNNEENRQEDKEEIRRIKEEEIRKRIEIAMNEQKIEAEKLANKKEEEKIVEERNRQKENKEKQKKHIKIWKKLLIAIVILAIIGISTVAFLFYGPYKGFRDWWITTAMTTMRHQYLATWFFSQEIIDEVLSKNRVEEVEGITDTTLIKPTEDKEEEIIYENKYERQILAKGIDPEEYDIYEDNEDYRIIEIQGKKYSGYLAAIYDPARVKAVASRKVGESGQYLTTMVKENNAILGINGGGFLDEGHNGNGSMPHGITISGGKVITTNNYKGSGGLIGFDNKNRLILGKMNLSQAKELKIRDAVTWGPYLIMNGEPSKILGNGGWGTAPRTAIGQRKDGVVLMLVLDGRRATKPGADMNDLIEIMQRYGAYNAVNLDGGTSSVMVVGDKIINDPIDSTGAHRTRYIATGFIVTKKAEK